MDLPRTVTMQAALMLVNREQARVQTPAAPALHGWLRGVVFLPHIHTYTRCIIDGAICGGLLELTLCLTHTVAWRILFSVTKRSRITLRNEKEPAKLSYIS